MVTGYALRINTHTSTHARTHALARRLTHTQVLEDFTMAGKEEFKAWNQKEMDV